MGGGMIGYNHDNQTFDFCYWDMQTSGWDTSQGGVGRNTDELTYPYDIDTYIGWAFPAIWSADFPVTINDGYPYLTGNHVTGTDDNSPEVTDLELTTYPNPFKQKTTISFKTTKASQITLEVYTLKGQKVNQWVITDYPRGKYSIIWDGKTDEGKTVPSGVYLCRIKSGGDSAVRKLTLLK